MQPLLARDLVKVYEDRPVLDGISITAAPGRRIGLVGENGAGKSTLLRLLAGTEPPDSGEVTRPADTGLLAQALPFAGHATVRTVVDDALADVRRALRRLDELATRLDDEHALREYGEVLEWAQARDAWDADRRATLVLDGLGLAEVDTRRRLDTLLGGPRSRLALAALLVRRPGALLLDEPTNHLDDEAVAFVEAHLRGLPGVVVLASHDRVFLDAVCTAVVDLDPSRAGVTRYGGAYSDYLHAKRAERARWEQQYATEQGELVALRHAVAVTSRLVSHERAPRDNDKMAYDFFGGRVQRQISCRVRNAVQRLDERTARQVRKPPAPLRFAATVTAAGSSGLALSARGLRVSGRLALDALDVPADGRLLVTGPNGSGKSTLLAVLAGRLRPTRQCTAPVGCESGCSSRTSRSPTRSGPRGRCTRVRRRSPSWVSSRRAISTGRWACSRWVSGAGWRWPCWWLAPRTCCCSTKPTNHLSLTLVEDWRTPCAPLLARWSRRAMTGGCAAGGTARNWRYTPRE